MSRRIQSLALIAILLTGLPVRASGAGTALTARVEIASMSPAGLDALQVGLAARGVTLQADASGETVRLTLTAGCRRTLLAALDDLAAATPAKIQVVDIDGAEFQAVARRVHTLETPQPCRDAARPATPADVSPPAPMAIGCTIVEPSDAECAWAPSARVTRGPPA